MLLAALQQRMIFVPGLPALVSDKPYSMSAVAKSGATAGFRPAMTSLP
jgi:hypothetical protein